MQWTGMLIPTLREMPKDAEATSHRLMLRAGLIRKLASGIYSYLPLGYRVLKKIVNIVREEMNAAGAQEVLLPTIHPVDIWQKTGRYDVLKDILMTIQKPDKQELVLGPTHEEIITELVAAYVTSYKDLPLNLYQIQTKFRDEARPRFGVIRSKEFIMKDAYSFDATWDGLEVSYTAMYEAYKKMFDRCGLHYEIVAADPGAMGGDVSHEFMVKVPFGEDIIVSCSACKLSSSLEVAACKRDSEHANKKEKLQPVEEFDTPNLKTIDEIAQTYKVKPAKMVKTLIYITNGEPVACLVRGDCDICEAKLKKVLKTESLVLADAKIIEDITGAPVGFAGPVGLRKPIPFIMDYSVEGLKNFVTGANKKDKHLKNVNYERDFPCATFVDIRYVREGDSCPECTQGHIKLERALEIGHVFKLGKKYSKALKAHFMDEQGQEQKIIMGCYGIGINRIMAASIELHHDEHGIQWPLAIAPFTILILTVNQSHTESVTCAEQLYEKLVSNGIDVLWDDREVRAGVKFNDADLIGFPLVLVVSERNMKKNMVELKIRADGSSRLIPMPSITDEVEQLIVSSL